MKEKGSISRKQIVIFVCVAYGLAWTIQVIASYFGTQEGLANRGIYQVLLMVCMYAPFLAVLAARIPLRGMGWKPQLKGKVGWVFFALWMPFLFALLGAGLYFAIFPGQFDGELTLVKQALGEVGLAQLEAQGLTVQTYFVISMIQALTFAPFINMLLAIGEEIGWRGVLYPMLKDRFGKTKGRILGGVCWGVWHWPLMLLAGYEYGKDYPGAPVLGLLVFCAFAVVGGILLDLTYEKTQCIWLPALMHGAINSLSSFAYLVKPEYSDRMVFGPMFQGLIGMVPIALAAVLICVQSRRGVRN